MLARRGAGATDNVARLSHSQSADRLRQRLAHTVKLETERWPGVESVDTDGEDDASGSGSARGEQEDAPPFAFSRRLTRKLLTRSATSSAAGTGGGDHDDDAAAPARSRSKSPSRSFTRRAPRKATTVAVAPQLGVRGGKHRAARSRNEYHLVTNAFQARGGIRHVKTRGRLRLTVSDAMSGERVGRVAALANCRPDRCRRTRRTCAVLWAGLSLRHHG